MARERSGVAARKRRKKKTTPKRMRKLDMPALAMSVDQFCALNSIGRDLFYMLMREGKAPQCMLVGKKRRLISFEAAEAWRRERERETAEAAAPT